jgi:hypothetical protein
LGFD